MTQTIEQLQARVAELEAALQRAQNSDEHNFNRWQSAVGKVAELEAENDRLKSMATTKGAMGLLADQLNKLAAAQAEIKRLRDALALAKSGFNQAAMGIIIQRELEENFNLCSDALATPISTEALDAYVAENVKEATAEFRNAWNKGEWPVTFANEQIATLTRQRDLAVEALEFAQEKIAELHLDAGDGECHYPLIDDALSTIKESEVK